MLKHIEVHSIQCKPECMSTETHGEDEGITECLWQQRSQLYDQHSNDLTAGVSLCLKGAVLGNYFK